MVIDPGISALPEDEERERFRALQGRLVDIWRGVEGEDCWEHTSVVVPSLSVNQEELAKVSGASYYEERLLFTLIRLRNPRARMIYVTSQPIHPDIIDYYLQLLTGVPAAHARRRLFLASVHDASPEPLTAKILARPRLLARLRAYIPDPRRAYLTCYNSTLLERRLAVALGIPLNGVDPDLLYLGTKTGSRRVFAEAGVEHPLGHEDLHSRDELVDALVDLFERRPRLHKAVIKLNESFSGEGNAIYVYPRSLPDEPQARREAIDAQLERVRWSSAQETLPGFLRKLGQMGGIVEEFVDGDEVRSPSVQMRIRPDGVPVVVSTHDQHLGGVTGQVYLGCRFPAAEEYRTTIQREALKIGAALSRYGVISRFGIDFLAVRDRGGPWRTYAVEINLRMGGTTPPFLALEFLTEGAIDPDTGLLVTPHGKAKFYYATDNLRSPAYRGMLPEDFMELLTLRGIQYLPARQTGVLFYMIGALSQFGKIGVTSIGDSREEAEAIYERMVAILDEETGAGGDARPGGRLEPLFEHQIAHME